MARSRMYRYFTNGVDLHRAIADRAVAWVNASLAPLWKLSGTPMEMVHSAINSHMRWLSEHNHLYWYLSKHAMPDSRTSIVDIKSAICQHLTRLLEHCLSVFGIDGRVAEPLAYGVVGLVESSVIRWLDNPHGIEAPELADRLGRWVWKMLDDTLREGGVELDPHVPFAVPDLPFPPGSGSR